MKTKGLITEVVHKTTSRDVSNVKNVDNNLILAEDEVNGSPEFTGTESGNSSRVKK